MKPITSPLFPQPKHLKICLAGVDVERGGFFLVKGATGFEVGARTAQLDVLAHHLDDVGGGAHPIGKLAVAGANFAHFNLAGSRIDLLAPCSSVPNKVLAFH
jgi:hypothetical protein